MVSGEFGRGVSPDTVKKHMENRALVGGWLENFNLARKFQSWRAILNFSILGPLEERGVRA